MSAITGLFRGRGTDEPAETGPVRLGTFAGVFTPTVLTILGAIMYLRLGWVVGNAGILGAIAIIMLAHVITVTTGLAVSSIAYQLARNWKGRIHLYSAVGRPEDKPDAEAYLAAILSLARLGRIADFEALVMP